MLKMFRPKGLFLLPFITFSLSLISGCSNSNITENEKVINKIESEIHMPKSSNKIGEYSRFYSGDVKSVVHAVYIIQKLEHREFIKADCLELNTVSYPCNDPQFGIIEPNATKWIRDSRNLPIQNGGGCSYIEIKYDVRISKFIQIECNGPR